MTEVTHWPLSKERFEKLCWQSIPILQYLLRQTPLQFIHFKGKGYSTPIFNPCCTFDLSLLSPTLPDPIIAADRVEKWKFDDNLFRENAKIKLYIARLPSQLEYNKAIKDSDLRYNLELPEILYHIYEVLVLLCAHLKYLRISWPKEILFRIQLRWEWYFIQLISIHRLITMNWIMLKSTFLSWLIVNWISAKF